MVEHARNVVNLLRIASCSQNQVIILTAVAIRVESADPLGQVLSQDQQVADVVFGQEQVRGPIRLEERIEPSPEPIDLIFVAVKQVGIGYLVDGFADMGKSIRGQRVVVIEERKV